MNMNNLMNMNNQMNMNNLMNINNQMNNINNQINLNNQMNLGNFAQDWEMAYLSIKDDDFSNKINIIFNYKKMKYNDYYDFNEKVSEVKKDGHQNME